MTLDDYQHETARTLTTSARLRHARAALKQAATLLRDAAALGTLSHGTRGAFLAAARLVDADAGWTDILERWANADLEAVRAAKRGRRAA